MANSRYDYIKYYDNSTSSFKIPQQIKVYNGSSWVDLGTKDSYSLKKLNVHNGSNFICATCYRQDYDYPGYVQIGTNKYIDLKKAGGTYLSSNWNTNGSKLTMKVNVSETTPLYTSYCNNQGNIYESFVNLIAVVTGTKVKLKVESYYYGKNSSGDIVKTSVSTTTFNQEWDVNVDQIIYIELASSKIKATINGVAQSATLQHHIVYSPRYQRVGTQSSIIGKKSQGADVSSSQSTYGNAKIKTFSTNNSYGTFDVNFETATNGATSVNSTGTLNDSGNNPAYAQTSGTNVTRLQYTEYIRQTV